MSDIFSAAGQVAAAGIQAGAVKDAAAMQIDALNKQRNYVFNNLDPSVISPQVTQADIARANNRLALQGQIDPALLNARYAAEAQQAAQLGEFGPGSQADRVARQAAGEAVAGTPGLTEAKDALVAQAMADLKSGATLPPDVQAELVKAGLEKSGMVTGGAATQGTGGQILRTILGSAGLELKAKRTAEAQGLLASAQNLETSRQNILQGLFPALTNQQLGNLRASQSVAQQSQDFLPTVGPTGTDIANLWLARVGATNQLAQQAATVGAQSAMGQANAYGQMIGAGTRGVGGSFPMIQSGWNSLTSGGGGGGYQGGYMGGSSGVPASQDWSSNFGMGF